MQSSIGQLKSYKIDSIINNRIKIIFTQLNSIRFKELVKYLSHQNEYIRLEFYKPGLKSIIFNSDNSQLFILEFESKHFDLYFCLENIEIIINVNEFNRYLTNISPKDYLEISLQSLSDLNLKINILDFNYQIKETHQLSKINNIEIENISIAPFEFETCYQIQSEYLKHLINLLHIISLKKTIDIEISYNRVTFRTFGIFKYQQRLEIQDYVANISNLNYASRFQGQNYDIFLKMITRKKTNHQSINQIPVDIWKKIFQLSVNSGYGIYYDQIDFTVIDNLKEDRLSSNLNHPDMYVKTFDSKKLKDLIDLGHNLNSNTLILYLRENTPLIFDHNIKQFGSFKSILAPTST